MPKIDKELLKKHQFWIGLGLFVVIWLVGVVMVAAGGDETKEKAWETAKKTIETAKTSNPKSEAFQKPWNDHGKKFHDYKDVVWKEAWLKQEPIYTWPEGMRVVPKYPDDPFGPTVQEDQNNRGRFRSDLYPEQFTGLEEYVYPAEFLGGFNTVIQKQTWRRDKEPTREEIWLAQEDYWVRREMLTMVRVALDRAALFHEVKPDAPAKLPAGVVAQRVFKNANWQLTLVIKHGANNRELIIGKESTIKNINVAQKILALVNPKSNQKGLPFRIFQENAAYVMNIAGEPLAFDAETAFNEDFSVQPVVLSKDFNIEQVLDWEVSPIRRIDSLMLPWHASRTLLAGLQIRPDLKQLDPEEPSLPAAPGAPGAPAFAPPGVPPAAGPGAKGPAGAAAAEEVDATPVNQIPRERYMHVTPQCRHLPLAMRLIVDQTNIEDVLAAVANSPLRVQITQVTFYHLPSVTRETPSTDTTPAPSPAAPPGPIVRGGPGLPGRQFGRIRGMGRFLSRPPGPGGAPAASVAPTASDKPDEKKGQVPDAARLMELTIYGVASLYERFPARPKAPAPPGGAAPGGVPGAPHVPGAPIAPGALK